MVLHIQFQTDGKMLSKRILKPLLPEKVPPLFSKNRQQRVQSYQQQQSSSELNNMYLTLQQSLFLFLLSSFDSKPQETLQRVNMQE